MILKQQVVLFITKTHCFCCAQLLLDISGFAIVYRFVIIVVVIFLFTNLLWRGDSEGTFVVLE